MFCIAEDEVLLRVLSILSSLLLSLVNACSFWLGDNDLKKSTAPDIKLFAIIPKAAPLKAPETKPLKPEGFNCAAEAFLTSVKYFSAAATSVVSAPKPSKAFL